jgi:hypothetical protein
VRLVSDSAVPPQTMAIAVGISQLGRSSTGTKICAQIQGETVPWMAACAVSRASLSSRNSAGGEGDDQEDRREDRKDSCCHHMKSFSFGMSA